MYDPNETTGDVSKSEVTESVTVERVEADVESPGTDSARPDEDDDPESHAGDFADGDNS